MKSRVAGQNQRKMVRMPAGGVGAVDPLGVASSAEERRSGCSSRRLVKPSPRYTAEAPLQRTK